MGRGQRKVYCLNEIVHNPRVVRDLASRGLSFVRSVSEVPRGATLLFSAHGVPPSVRRKADERGLKVIDATCPFVTKVHNEVRRYSKAGYRVLLVGDPSHEEVVGVVGEAPENVEVVTDVDAARHVLAGSESQPVAVVTQTTLNVREREHIIEVLQNRFDSLITPEKSDVCYATQNRQDAVTELAKRTQRVLVLGGRNSANTNRLVEVADAAGGRGVLVESREDLRGLDWKGVEIVGLTAGASTPDVFVREVLRELAKRGYDDVEHLELAEEGMHFALPPELRR